MPLEADVPANRAGGWAMACQPSRGYRPVSLGAFRRAARVVGTMVLLACGCRPQWVHGQAAASTIAETTDDAGHAVKLSIPTRRVVSLVPSATETLIAIGAASQIVGRTRYDTEAEVRSRPSVGGGIDPSIEAIVELHPDVVIGWEGVNREDTRDALARVGVPVFLLRTQDTTDIFHGIAVIGRLTGHDTDGARVAASVRKTLADVHRLAAGRPAPSVFYVVYNDPPMTAGPQTFIGQLISLAGGRSIFGDTRVLWPTVSMEEIVRRDPDLIILPVGEFKSNSVERLHHLVGWRDLRAVREGHVVTVPADLMSRPSPSIAEAARVLLKAFHPDAVSQLAPGVASVGPSAPGTPR
jgi:iron complex transport system substrate-binding protein